MKKIFLFILLFVGGIASGQIISASSNYRVRASGCATKLLDAYSGAAAAYSLRKLDADYAGSAIRVRRSDNTEQDIGFVGCGDLDTASLKTFVGTGGTDDGFVVTWYDQSGNGRDATQATAADQPKIMDNGVVYRKNSLPSIYFNYSFLLASFSSVAITAHSTFGVFVATASAASYARIFTFRVASRYDYEDYIPFLSNGTSTTSFASYVGGGVSVVTTSNTVLNLFQNIQTGSATDNYINGGSASNSSNSFSLSIIRYGIGSSCLITDASGNGQTISYISELIAYPSNKSSDRTSIRDNINTYYTVY